MAGVISSEYTRTYTSFSGADIVASFNGVIIGELQAITFSISREKAPIYTFGSAEPRSFSRGKRGIAGTMVFTVFDRDGLIEALKEHSAMVQKIGAGIVDTQPITIDEWDQLMTAGAGATPEAAIQQTNSIAAYTMPMYADEVPPFDITISLANEYGQKAVMVIYGVEVLNEGSGFSIDNVTTEKACTFVARRIEHLKKVED